MAHNIPQAPGDSMHGNIIEDIPHRDSQWHRDLSLEDLLRLGHKAGRKAGICMISLDEDIQTISVAHMISRNKGEEEHELQRIEYICGFGPGEFRVHSPGNLIYVRLDYRQLLNQGGWIMLSSLRIMESIEQYYTNMCKEAREHGTAPDFTDYYNLCFGQNKNLNKNLKYRIVPLGALSLNDPVVRPGKVYHNLLELPEFSYWTHPLCAIWHAGGHIDRLEAWSFKLIFLRLPAEHMQRLQAALRIWNIWKSIPLPQSVSSLTMATNARLLIKGKPGVGSKI